MPTIHVCLISDQPIPNLLPLLLEKPEQTIFLVSPERTAQADRLKKIVMPRGISVTFKEISAYDFTAISSVCEDIENEANAANTDLVLNVTGGTKITALAAFQVFYFNNRRIIYLDTFNKRLLQLAPESIATDITDNLIKTKDYLSAYGMNFLSPDVSDDTQRKPDLQKMAEILIKDSALLSRLNSAIERHGKNPARINLALNELGGSAEILAAAMTATGAAEQTNSNNLHISTPENIFFCHGGWLEEYVYWTIKDLNRKHLDVALNVKVAWDGKGKQTTHNEFDVLFTYDNRLHLISCKTSNPERETDTGDKATETLNELDTLADRAGGLFGRAMLVSARKLRDVDRERAKKMKIELVDGHNVLRLKEHIQNWLTTR
jgi:hypothetical protein